mgnify:CR=1 FL=1
MKAPPEPSVADTASNAEAQATVLTLVVRHFHFGLVCIINSQAVVVATRDIHVKELRTRCAFEIHASSAIYLPRATTHPAVVRETVEAIAERECHAATVIEYRSHHSRMI